MTIRANAFTYFPFVLPCVFDSNSPCPYPGVNVDLYNVAMRPYRVVDGGTEYTRVGREGSTTDSCDGPDGSYASLRCNRTDLSMNLFYLVDEALLRQFDMSMAVDMDRKFIVVPKIRKSNLVPFIRMFEPSAWIAVLIMIVLHRIALRARRFPHATRFYLALSHFAFFFLRCRTESSIVSGWLQDLVLSPLVSEANHLKQLAVGIREGQVKMAFSHSSRERLTQTASGRLRRVIDAVIDTPDSYFVLPTGMSCLEAVAAAARRNLQGYGVQHVVTETSENNIQHLRCQDKRYVHGFYHLTANLAFAFRKGSRIREKFDKRLWTTLAATGTHEFVNSRKRLYWRSHDCGDANDPSLVKPKPVKPVQMKTAYTVSGAGFLLALLVLLGEFLHHRTAAGMI